MNKDFIPYEQALELKELGFNEPCFAKHTVVPEDEINSFVIPEQAFSNDKQLFGSDKHYNNKFFEEEGTISAPTFSQAFRWFRDTHKLHNGIYPYYDNWYVYQINDLRSTTSTEITSGLMRYEEAELAGLKKLIETVKEK